MYQNKSNLKYCSRTAFAAAISKTKRIMRPEPYRIAAAAFKTAAPLNKIPLMQILSGKLAPVCKSAHGFNGR